MRATRPQPRTPPARPRRPADHGLLAVGRSLAGAIVDIIWPQTCVACGVWIPGDLGLLCPDCLAGVEEAAAVPACPRCGRSVSPLSVFGNRCGLCRHERYWNIAGMARIGEYRVEPLREMLRQLKFAVPDRPAAVLGRWLARALRRQPWFAEIESLVPVPMHWMRRWQRPCDHALVLAEAVSERLGIPVRRSAVRRPRYSRSQTHTHSRAERFRNVRGCFAVARGHAVAGRTVCIIDNLVVTGATLHEVAKVLRRAGARRVYAAIAARSVAAGSRETHPQAAGHPTQPQGNPAEPRPGGSGQLPPDWAGRDSRR